jgi:ribosome-interacting GTPase 1
MCPLTKMGDDPADAATRILGSYRIHNAEVVFREDASLEDLIDVIEGNRKYIKCLYVYNKIDTLSIEEIDSLARYPDAVVISIHLNLNVDYMLKKMWEYMGLLRVYTKRRGQPPDLVQPVILSHQRHGITVESVCNSISRDFMPIFNFALVWGRSTKYNPQRVGPTHVLSDEDVVQIALKTVTQQKHSKDYQSRVDQALAKLQKERKRLHKIKRK